MGARVLPSHSRHTTQGAGLAVPVGARLAGYTPSYKRHLVFGYSPFTSRGGAVKATHTTHTTCAPPTQVVRHVPAQRKTQAPRRGRVAFDFLHAT